MVSAPTIIVLAFTLIHVIIGIKAQWAINKFYLNLSQKVINSVLIWLIPILWGWITLKFLIRDEMKVTIRSERKVKQGGTTDHWEVLTGGHTGSAAGGSDDGGGAGGD